MFLFHFPPRAEIYRGRFDGISKQCVSSIKTLFGCSKSNSFIFPLGRNLSWEFLRCLKNSMLSCETHVCFYIKSASIHTVFSSSWQDIMSGSAVIHLSLQAIAVTTIALSSVAAESWFLVAPGWNSKSIQNMTEVSMSMCFNLPSPLEVTVLGSGLSHRNFTQAVQWVWCAESLDFFLCLRLKRCDC